jgi:hypothetical protein
MAEASAQGTMAKARWRRSKAETPATQESPIIDGGGLWAVGRPATTARLAEAVL